MAKIPSSSRKARRHNPLSDDLNSTGLLRTKAQKKVKPEAEGSKYVDSRASRKILSIGQDLIAEEEQEARAVLPNPAFDFGSRLLNEKANENDDIYPDDEEAWGDEDEEVEEMEIDPNDLNLFNKFVFGNEDTIEPQPNDSEQGQGTSLADLILEKIAAHESSQTREHVSQSGGPPENAVELPAKVLEVYSKIGLLLSRYKSGKLPKPFKIIPSLPQWEELLSITRPESWSPNACYEATRIFVSSKPHIVQRFLEVVVLDRVREDIHETKKLNYHLYKALQKSLYKPSAFFKGFLFPLVNSGTCTLREAHIISSVLIKRTIPVLHSAAALLRLTELAAEQTCLSTDNAGATNIFIRVLLEKKYALPYKVIDSLVFHFLRFRPASSMQQQPSSPSSSLLAINDPKLPVLWHQCLLAFAQHYRNDITEDQREALLDLLLAREHREIGPEVRRELLEGRGRGVMVGEGEEMEGEGGDDTMVM